MAATVGIIIIGDEILKGVVQDTNSHFLTQRLWQLGVKVDKISTIPDDVDTIAQETRVFSVKYDFVITTGGLGPTHDDVTMEGIAKAFGEELVHCKELEQVWPDSTDLTSKFVLKMMKLPSSARLQYGTDPACPLTVVHNVHVYPGVPQYLTATFESNKRLYCVSEVRFYRLVALMRADELEMAGFLEEAQQKYEGLVSIGSYPVVGNSLHTLKVTGESRCKSSLDEMCAHLRGNVAAGRIIQIRMSRSRSHASASLESSEQTEEHSPKSGLNWLFHDKAVEFVDPLRSKVVCSKEVFEECLSQYDPTQLCLAYNGGKDCTVLLHLLHLIRQRRGETGKIAALYIASPNPFPEVETFIKASIDKYNLDLVKITGSIKEALFELKQRYPQIKAILLGTRFTDPHSDNLTVFCPTDDKWPQYMRVHPILEWSYTDVWSYLRLLNVPCCSLYDEGYTSLGSTNNTVPNPSLKTNHSHSEMTGSYQPAYLLTDDTLERAGRT